jgi:hypothetical protein
MDRFSAVMSGDKRANEVRGRVWRARRVLVAVALAGTVALPGCGGGDDGPSVETPGDATDSSGSGSGSTSTSGSDGSSSGPTRPTTTTTRELSP